MTLAMAGIRREYGVIVAQVNLEVHLGRGDGHKGRCGRESPRSRSRRPVDRASGDKPGAAQYRHVVSCAGPGGAGRALSGATAEAFAAEDPGAHRGRGHRRPPGIELRHARICSASAGSSSSSCRWMRPMRRFFDRFCVLERHSPCRSDTGSIRRPLSCTTDGHPDLRAARRRCAHRPGRPDTADRHRDRRRVAGTRRPVQQHGCPTAGSSTRPSNARSRKRTHDTAQSVEELRALGEVSQAVNSTLDLETVLDTIVAKAVQLSGADAGTMYVFDEASGEFRLRAAYGMSEDLIAITLEEQHAGLSDWIAEVDQTGARRCRSPICAMNPLPPVEQAAPVQQIVLEAGYRARMIVPLVGADRVPRRPRGASQDDRRISRPDDGSAADLRGAIGARHSERAPVPRSRGQGPSARSGEPAQVAVPRQYEPRALRRCTP